MSAGETLYKGMFTGHVSLYLRQNSCPKTQNMHALVCNNLPCMGLYIMAGNQLRPCGQRRPDSWVNLSLFIFVPWGEARKARSSLSPVTECVSTVNLIHLQGGFKPVSHFWLTPAVTGKTWSKLRSWPSLSWDAVDHASPFYLFRNKIKQAKKLLKGLCFWTQQGQPDPGTSVTAT